MEEGRQQGGRIARLMVEALRFMEEFEDGPDRLEMFLKEESRRRNADETQPAR